MRIADIRREYNLAGLRRADLEPEPIAQFRKWFAQAAGLRTAGRVRKRLIHLYKKIFLIGEAELIDVNAVTLATTDDAGRPSARIVLLKGLDERGFIFYSNYGSRKGRELAQNPNAAMVFYWPDQERQVCVAGRVEKVSREEAETYFKTRPRGSRLAAWASPQSAVLENRAALEARWRQYEAKYPGDEVPMPPEWGGYVLRPDRVEFWQGRPSRLHDRFQYLRQPDQTWRIERLSP